MTDPAWIGYKAEGTVTVSVDGTEILYDNLEPFGNGDWALYNIATDPGVGTKQKGDGCLLDESAEENA